MMRKKLASLGMTALLLIGLAATSQTVSASDDELITATPP